MIDPNKVHEVHEAALAEGRERGKHETLDTLWHNVLGQVRCICIEPGAQSPQEHVSTCPFGRAAKVFQEYHAALNEGAETQDFPGQRALGANFEKGLRRGRRAAIDELKERALTFMPCTCSAWVPGVRRKDGEHDSGCPRKIILDACEAFHDKLNTEAKMEGVQDPSAPIHLKAGEGLLQTKEGDLKVVKIQDLEIWAKYHYLKAVVVQCEREAKGDSEVLQGIGSTAIEAVTALRAERDRLKNIYARARNEMLMRTPCTCAQGGIQWGKSHAPTCPLGVALTEFAESP